MALNKLSHAPTIQKDIENLQAAQSQLIVERERYHDNHPTIISLQNQIAVFEDSLQQRMAKILGTSSQFSVENLLTSARENLPQQLTSELAFDRLLNKNLLKYLNY